MIGLAITPSPPATEYGWVQLLTDDAVFSPYISDSNVKMGDGTMHRTASISLPAGPPGVGTCAPTVAGACWDQGCYGRKMQMRGYRGGGGTYASTLRNLRCYLTDPDRYFAFIQKRLDSGRFDYWRWNIHGDMPTEDYLDRTLWAANLNPNVNHLAFTKRYDWAIDRQDHLPPNYALMLSVWPNLPLPTRKHILPYAYLLDPAHPDERIPEGTRVCPGRCPTCRTCWDRLPKQLPKH